MGITETADNDTDLPNTLTVSLIKGSLSIVIRIRELLVAQAKCDGSLTLAYLMHNINK